MGGQTITAIIECFHKLHFMFLSTKLSMCLPKCAPKNKILRQVVHVYESNGLLKILLAGYKNKTTAVIVVEKKTAQKKRQHLLNTCKLAKNELKVYIDRLLCCKKSIEAENEAYSPNGILYS